jgi:hypothetical protein
LSALHPQRWIQGTGTLRLSARYGVDRQAAKVAAMLALKVVSVVVVAVAMNMALAHALELPGKLRLPKEQYLAVQTIYYPGFTFAGFTEPLSVMLTALLAFLAPWGSPSFWLTLGACVALTLMHAIYWVLIHPVNNFWLRDTGLQGAGKTFFAFGARERAQMDWTYLRDRWEYSHAARAGLALLALVLLVSAVTG